MMQPASGWEGDRLVWLGEGTMGGKTMVARDTFTKKGAGLLHVGEMKFDDEQFVVRDEVCKRSAAGK